MVEAHGHNISQDQRPIRQSFERERQTLTARCQHRFSTQNVMAHDGTGVKSDKSHRQHRP